MRAREVKKDDCGCFSLTEGPDEDWDEVRDCYDEANLESNLMGWGQYDKLYRCVNHAEGAQELQWVVPPVCQGQMVVVSYAADASGIWRCTEDASVGQTVHEFVDWDDLCTCPEGADEPDEDCEGCAPFEPWNREPTVPEDLWMCMDEERFYFVGEGDPIDLIDEESLAEVIEGIISGDYRPMNPILVWCETDGTFSIQSGLHSLHGDEVALSGDLRTTDGDGVTLWFQDASPGDGMGLAEDPSVQKEVRNWIAAAREGAST